MRFTNIRCFLYDEGMNEQLESLKKYVAENSARGVSLPAIRKELSGKGWNESDIEMAIGSDETLSVQTGWMENARIMHIILAGGAAASLAAIASFVAKFGGEFGSAPLFVVADFLNLVVAYSIWKKTAFASHSMWYRILIGLLLIPATIFALGSTLFFFDACLGYLGTSLLSLDVKESAKIILFLFGLPVQVAVYLLSSITVGILHYRRKKAGGIGLAGVLRGHVYFLVLAAIATAALFGSFGNSYFMRQ